MNEHRLFKSEQTAAAYVAGGLDPTVQEQFELHLLGCVDCREEVESWRALRDSLPPERKPPRESTVPMSMVAHYGEIKRNYEKYLQDAESAGFRLVQLAPGIERDVTEEYKQRLRDAIAEYTDLIKRLKAL